ncbi:MULTISPECIES: UDP-glucose 4-epimerase GalE [unclassified Cyanobium]|uniref:UDP-glucose 4-epimerase GalE n=1 Tax=unclassified Cyanobium TaxID=2627006 RepID=UPI0020CE08FB|nr:MULTISPECIES: UDP-glucose 4-epimerase GalE [unclassified Cyanobium]MCP9833652.1 UDP-glucose 4-epimerase GalE [Cyanobium sp. La Preciosa 7G6]MCP9857629.1 UDP-glucose 4-epimerase GalE [Cyanobium sp. Cruz-8H5]MCP9864798.1 UDP-glucose 4-epimerase GalE [Cyanobium sp. Cruz-8D1]MCP9936590.1 UDP-glucose 4-epimerase GalE [Cyanobium sp. Aljojuca 7A6]
MRILVTGGAGYIGSHAVRALTRAGHQPVVLDNLVYGHADIVEKTLKVPLVLGQVGDREVLEPLLRGRHPALDGTPLEGKPIEAVLHFAAYAYVGESVSDPAKYYRNNLGDTLTLLEALVATERPLPIVFSSTCATYGIPQQVPITEDHPQAPINPYGRSKWMVEQLLTDFAAAYGLPSVIFRYFNAAGADPEGDLGEDHDPETHLIPRVLDTMSGREPYLQIFGDDYPTPDGTCIRDYIHVADLADAHVLGLERLLRLREREESERKPLIYNLGNGTGYSVQQVIETAKAVTGRGLLAHMAKRRDGDPPQLVAGASRAHQELGWRPRFPELETIIEHAWAWHQRRYQG